MKSFLSEFCVRGYPHIRHHSQMIGDRIQIYVSQTQGT